MHANVCMYVHTRTLRKRKTCRIIFSINGVPNNIKHTHTFARLHFTLHSYYIDQILPLQKQIFIHRRY